MINICKSMNMSFKWCIDFVSSRYSIICIHSEPWFAIAEWNANDSRSRFNTLWLAMLSSVMMISTSSLFMMLFVQLWNVLHLFFLRLPNWRCSFGFPRKCHYIVFDFILFSNSFPTSISDELLHFSDWHSISVRGVLFLNGSSFLKYE